MFGADVSSLVLFRVFSFQVSESSQICLKGRVEVEDERVCRSLRSLWSAC